MSTVLALRALGLGDFLTGLPALRGLRDAFPTATLVLAAPPALEPLALLSGAVDQVLPAEPLGPVACAAPDVAVNLHGRGPQSHLRLLERGARRLIAFRHPEIPESSGGPGWEPGEHEVARWCRLLSESGIPCDGRRLGLPRPQLPAPPAAVDAVLVHPGAGAPARRWPVERWVSVAREQRERGRRVVITAGPGESGLASAVAAGAGLAGGCILAGDLLELAAAVAAARAVVCADTGVAHLATALGTPSVVLFGPVPPSLWGPPAWHPHVALWTGGTGDPNGAEVDSGLLGITPERVVSALEVVA